MRITKKDKRDQSSTSPCAHLRAAYHNCFNRSFFFAPLTITGLVSFSFSWLFSSLKPFLNPNYYPLHTFCIGGIQRSLSKDSGAKRSVFLSGKNTELAFLYLPFPLLSFSYFLFKNPESHRSKFIILFVYVFVIGTFG